MRARKEPTCVSVVFETLLKVDDFRTGKQLQAETGLSCNQVSASLHELRKYSAAACLEENGQLFWFATPDKDQRTRVVNERVPEINPRKSRRIVKK